MYEQIQSWWLAVNSYEEPIEPTAALSRLRNTVGGPPLPTDSRDISDFVKANKAWNNSCVMVLYSLIAILTPEILSRLEASGLNIKVASKLNIQLIMDWMEVEYGCWSDAKRTYKNL